AILYSSWRRLQKAHSVRQRRFVASLWNFESGATEVGLIERDGRDSAHARGTVKTIRPCVCRDRGEMRGTVLANQIESKRLIGNGPAWNRSSERRFASD